MTDLLAPTSSTAPAPADRGLASACRFPGILVGAFVVLLYLRDRAWSPRRLDRAAWAMPLACAGLVAHMAYLWVRLGDPFDFGSTVRGSTQPSWRRR